MNVHIARIENGLSPLKQQLIHHPLYQKIKSPQHLHIFMEQHVFAVWDFMSLLKFLQRELTCVQLPWLPSEHTAAARMINEIVLGEETDIDRQGQPSSHYQLYLKAMDQAGADTSQIKQLLSAVGKGQPVAQAARQQAISKEVQDFMEFTFQTLSRGKLHEVAAVFAWGREDLIPDMFTSLVKDIQQNQSAHLEDFIYYLERHIELDADEHGPLAMQMMEALCGDDQQKWNQ
ncbi:DUF3050 domain-containing protein [Catalinimonas niigatensis]|uniref:DUF3050 domain-containing protein n=1 Tax=Catalinimonas niigatensis TaxID=1397264 RepID=UPI002666D8B9|nr:DUF3050 domain-containing protein [Catalinimonas niigatensis]WPP52467.1 DUF3050 domain-containing protein [Catalinimonas niigatensis]